MGNLLLRAPSRGFRKRFTPAQWAAAVTKNGGTYSANALAAVQLRDTAYTLLGIKPKLIYHNPRVGNDIIAAKTPWIHRKGPGFDVVSNGTYPTWVEANGLTAATDARMSTGILQTDTDPDSMSMGAYILNNATAVGTYMFGFSRSGVGEGITFLNTATNGLAFMDHRGKRIQSSPSGVISYDSYKTKGMIGATIKLSAASGYISRNGVIRGIAPLGNGGVGGTSDPYTLFSINFASGGDWIGTGDITPLDLANIAWVEHEANRIIGRQVTTDGLS